MIRLRLLSFILLILCFSIDPTHAGKSLKVFISADLEGVAGVVNAAQLSTAGFEYGHFRHLLTEEVNACIEGSFEAGATSITVADSHGNGLSILPDKINQKVRLIRAWPRPLEMMQGVDQGFDAAILLGYHASVNTPAAVRAHTLSSRRYFDVRLNGKRASEAMISAAVAGHFKVPVVLVSGDDITINEVHRTINKNITGVVVKKAIGYHSADSISPAEADRKSVV